VWKEIELTSGYVCILCIKLWCLHYIFMWGNAITANVIPLIVSQWFVSYWFISHWIISHLLVSYWMVSPWSVSHWYVSHLIVSNCFISQWITSAKLANYLNVRHSTWREKNVTSHNRRTKGFHNVGKELADTWILSTLYMINIIVYLNCIIIVRELYQSITWFVSNIIWFVSQRHLHSIKF